MENISSISPNGNYEMFFYNFIEPRMGMNMCNFYLYDIENKKRIDFDVLYTLFSGQRTSWSSMSNLVCLPIFTNLNEGFFIYDVCERVFSVIKFSNVWVLNCNIFENELVIEFRKDQVSNDRTDLYPTKFFSKPQDISIELSDLEWISIEEISAVKVKMEAAQVRELKLIDNGWREFKGALPSSTEISIWRLQQFADYGDIQSQIWLKKIKESTQDVNYWINASKYLGVVNRNVEY
nr:hypothetical protein [uncultured Mucilaginibacter sp.]